MQSLVSKVSACPGNGRTFRPVVETLESRALLAAIGHFHGVIAAAPGAEPAVAEAAIEVEAGDATRGPARASASETRATLAPPESAPLAEEVRGAISLFESSQSMSNGAAAQAASGSGLVNVVLLSDHSGHVPQSSDAPLPAHSGHGADSMPMAGAAAFAASHNHGGNAGEVGLVVAGGQRAFDLQVTDLEIAKTDHHAAESPEANGLTQKFAPKRCTVRYTAKEVYRDVTGERKCDCLPQGAVETNARESESANDEVTSVATIFTNFDGASCVPCQLQLAADAAVCSLAGVIDAKTLSAAPCEAERVEDGAWSRGVTSFFEGLQLVGWTLLGTSVIAVSLKRERKAEAAAWTNGLLTRDERQLLITSC